jgi:hypothetical protein
MEMKRSLAPLFQSGAKRWVRHVGIIGTLVAVTTLSHGGSCPLCKGFNGNGAPSPHYNGQTACNWDSSANLCSNKEEDKTSDYECLTEGNSPITMHGEVYVYNGSGWTASGAPCEDEVTECYTNDTGCGGNS